jgi:hypothetical protein
MRRMDKAPVLKGGSKNYIFDILSKHSTTINVYVMSILVLTIVFVKEFPLEIRAYAGTIPGNVVLFFATLIIADKYSWVSGLLMALLSLLLLSLGPRTVAEGFQSPYTNNMKIVTDKEKWWVEKVFKENPLAIQEDIVNTKQIQDGSNSSSSTSSQGGSQR